MTCGGRTLPGGIPNLSQMPAFKEGWELPPKTTMLRTMIDQLKAERYCNL